LKILFLCKRYYTNKDLIKDRFGRLYHLPVQLATIDHEVIVFAIDYRNAVEVGIKQKAVSFTTFSATPYNLPKLPFRLWRAVSQLKPEVIIASGDSHIGYLAMILSKYLKSRFIFDVYDFYPAFKGNRIPGMKYMFQTAVRRAELVTTVSKALTTELACLSRSMLLIENGIDDEIFHPVDIHEARRELQITSSEQIVGYFGSITPDRVLLLIKACEIARKDFPNLQLRLAGRLDSVDLVASWINYLGELPQEKIPIQIAACDVVSIPYINTMFNSMTGACKITEYLACSRPVVATRVADHVDIFKDAPAGLCDPKPESMAIAIKRQLLSPQLVPFPQELKWSSIAKKLEHRIEVMQGQ
jgi:glycosyltransferase involved in cell wall biosynthesis